MMLNDSLPNPEGGGELYECGMSTCPSCEQAFMRRRGWQRFCSDRCRMFHHQKERKCAVMEYRNMMRMRMAGKGEDVNRGNG